MQSGDIDARITAPVYHTNTGLLPVGDYYACVVTVRPAFIESDNFKSNSFHRLGTTISRVDQGNYGLIRIGTTIGVHTKGSVDPCASANLSANIYQR